MKTFDQEMFNKIVNLINTKDGYFYDVKKDKFEYKVTFYSYYIDYDGDNDDGSPIYRNVATKDITIYADELDFEGNKEGTHYL